MNARNLFSYSRHLLSHYKGYAIRLRNQFMPSPKQIVFVFGGRAQHWVGMGSDLYSKEKVFREYIQKCDVIIQNFGEKSILPNFEKNAASDFFEDEANVVLVLLSFQIALFELLKSKKILPNAVMGISLGEISAVYAAGGLSLEDAMKVGMSGVALSRKEKKEYALLHLQMPWANAKQIVKLCSVKLLPIYEANEQGTLVFCHKDEQEIAGEFLKAQNIKWHVLFSELAYPYHTELVLQHEELLKSFTKDIRHAPLQCHFYSSILGTAAQEGTILENDFWFRMLHLPVCTYALLKQLSTSHYNILLHINAPSFSEKNLIRNSTSKEKKIQTLYTIVPDCPELNLYKTTEQLLLKTKRYPSSLLNYQKNELQQFKEKINFYEPQFYKNPLPYLKYLQQAGNVHYLPRQKEWLVLDYASAEYVLKTPEIFSSSVHKTFDEFLLGADPPSHTFVRSIMQSLFTQQRFNIIAQYTLAKASELLEKLKHKKQFNLVDEFSIPLSQAVIAKFMGLSEEEAISLKNKIKQHPYEMKFFDDLKEFSKEYLKNLNSFDESTAGGMLLGFVRENKISFDAAVSLLRLLWVAGMTTTSMLVSSALFLLAQNPVLSDEVKNDDQLLNKFIEECLRLEAPESEARRITNKKVELGGEIIPAHSMVVLKFQTINRDPKYFKNPDAVDVNRSNKKHLSFGGGYHFCLGAGMARLEAKIAVKTFLEKFGAVKMDHHETEYFSSQHFRGLQKLIIISEKENAV